MADVLQLLIEERDRLNEAIAVLGGPRRRGRPVDGATKKAVENTRTQLGIHKSGLQTSPLFDDGR